MKTGKLYNTIRTKIIQTLLDDLYTIVEFDLVGSFETIATFNIQEELYRGYDESK